VRSMAKSQADRQTDIWWMAFVIEMGR